MDPSNIESFGKLLFEAFAGKNFRYGAALLVVAGVFWGGKALAKKFPFFGSSKGKALLAVSLALATGAATAFANGGVPGLADLQSALLTALGAAGGFSLLKPFFPEKSE